MNNCRRKRRCNIVCTFGSLNVCGDRDRVPNGLVSESACARGKTSTGILCNPRT